jgi:Arc/MetJ-type ribon-helix-helix transcriptional regulator
MSYQIPTNIQQIIEARMSTGLYASEDQLILAALTALDDYEEAVADIRAGLVEEEAGQTISMAEADRAIRQELGFPQ